jgi:RNA polymerase sigma-70 factor (ECF subfamily)
LFWCSKPVSKDRRERSIARRTDNQKKQARQRAKQDENVQLMLRVKDGDAEAFNELVERNAQIVHALVYRFLREPSMVEDITQDVFLRVYRNAHRYQPTAKFSTWLYRITANLCFNVMRSRKKSRLTSLDSIGDEESRMEVPDPSLATPGERLHGEELSEIVAAAIAELPEKQRVAIVLNKYEDKNYEQIGDVLELSTMAVKSLLSRARNNLRDKLSRYLDME